MTGATKGGVTIKVLTGRTAASLQRYRDSHEEGQESYLLSATRHCSHNAEVQIAEWKAVREEHGTQGAQRTQKASYETVDPETGLHSSGQMGTHVKEFSSGRWRKRPAREGEKPTHLRIEAGHLSVKESEAVHTIYAAGADLVNPDNPEDLKRFWDAVNAERDELYSGLQESRWLERNGKSGLTHVHVASNATVYADFESSNVQYLAGSKMAGDLTRVHSARAQFEQYLDTHPEHGLEQSLAKVGTPEYEAAQTRSGQKDYWDKSRGKESNKDQARRKSLEARQDAGVVDHDAYVAKMAELGVEVKEIGLRRGVPGKNHDYLYTVADAKQGVSGKVLGEDYSHAAIDAQLKLKARGKEIKPSTAKQQTGVVKPLPFETTAGASLGVEDQAALEQLRADVDAVGQIEADRKLEEQVAAVRHKSFDELLAEATNESGIYEEMGTVNAIEDMPRSASLRDAEARMAELRESDEYKALKPDGLAELETTAPSAPTAATASQGASESSAATKQDPAQQPPSAPATDTMSHGTAAPATTAKQSPEQKSPHAPSVAPQPVEETAPAFRSRIHDAKSTSAPRQERYNMLAPFEEHWHGQLPSTSAERIEFEQQAAAIGIGPSVLKGAKPHMSDELYAYLKPRAEQGSEGTASADRIKKLRNEKLPGLQKQAQADRFNAHGSQDRLREAEWDERFETGYLERIREDRAAGIYTSRAHERREHIEEKVSARAAELEPTDAQKRLASDSESLKREKSASKDRSYSMERD